jgi:hypothetical protein
MCLRATLARADIDKKEVREAWNKVISKETPRKCRIRREISLGGMYPVRKTGKANISC